MSRLVVRCTGLRKRFFSEVAVNAVDGVNLSLEEGTILSLVGPSGCGKTTTLRLIAGFEVPDSGQIEIRGTLVAAPGLHVPPEKRPVGMVFQDFALFPHLTVGRNITFGLGRGPGAGVRLQDLLNLVSLDGMEHRRPHELSGGQQQRVAVARALARGPVVLLLDEPFSNLHTELRVQMRQEIRDILRRSGTSAIFVTHDQEEALFMGDRVGVQRAGRIEQLDTPECVYHRPSTRFVAAFMGAADFLPVWRAEGGLECELGPLSRSVPPDAAGDLEVMVRPDDVLVQGDVAGSSRVLQGTFQGMFYQYTLALPSGRTVRCLAHHAVRLQPGDPVDVRLRPGDLLVLFRGDRAVVSPS